MAKYLSEEMISKCTPNSSRKAKVYQMLLSIYNVATSDENETESLENDKLYETCDDFARFSKGHWLHSKSDSLDTLKGCNFYDLVLNNMPCSRRKKALFIRLALFAHEYLYGTLNGIKRTLEDDDAQEEIADVMTLSGFGEDSEYQSPFSAVCVFFGLGEPTEYEVVNEEEEDDTFPTDNAEKVISDAVKDILEIVELSDFLTYQRVKERCDVILDALNCE